jgi:hypothetical protein
VAKRDWAWGLDGGVTVRATLDTASKVESIYVDDRLVSRSQPGGKSEGHRIAIARQPGGAYRAGNGPTEAIVRFDTIPDVTDGRPVPTADLTIDGKVIPSELYGAGRGAWLGSSLVYDGAMIAIGLVTMVVSSVLLWVYTFGVLAQLKHGDTYATSPYLFVVPFLGASMVVRGISNAVKARRARARAR